MVAEGQPATAVTAVTPLVRVSGSAVVGRKAPGWEATVVAGLEEAEAMSVGVPEPRLFPQPGHLLRFVVKGDAPGGKGPTGLCEVGGFEVERDLLVGRDRHHPFN